jgi:hypothetical protein
MARFDKARRVLISELQSRKRELQIMLESSDRDFEKQQKLFDEYCDMLDASDTLAKIELGEDNSKKDPRLT